MMADIVGVFLHPEKKRQVQRLTVEGLMQTQKTNLLWVCCIIVINVKQNETSLRPTDMSFVLNRARTVVYILYTIKRE